MFGLRVRGQCTRTTGRRGGAVGVKRTGKPMPAGAAGGAAPSAASAATVGITPPAPSAESASKAPTGTTKEAPKN